MTASAAPVRGGLVALQVASLVAKAPGALVGAPRQPLFERTFQL